MLLPIVSDISELINDVKTVSNLQNVDNRALHQTQVVVRESANLLKHIQTQLLPNLEKDLGNILIASHTKQNTQNMINQGELFQRFDTQIHVIDDMTNRMNMDHQNLKGSLETLQTQQEINFKIVCTELKQSETRVDNLVSIVETLVLQLTKNSAEQKIHNNLNKTLARKN